MLPFTGMKRIGVVLILGLAALNFAAYRQARAFTHFAPPGHRTPSPQMLSLGQKMQVPVKGYRSRGALDLARAKPESKAMKTTAATALRSRSQAAGSTRMSQSQMPFGGRESSW